MVQTVLARAERLPLADAAAAYAAAGLAVLPCVPRGKRPLTRHGLSEASSDLERIASWWARWPEANIGLATGRPGGFDVLDVDVRPSGSGFAALARARTAGLVEGWAAVVRSPSGGLHLYFPCDGDRVQSSWALAAAHVDLLAAGRYVIAAPSQASTGEGRRRGYTVIASASEARPLDGAALRELLAPAPRRGRRQSGALGGELSGQRLAGWLACQPEGNRNRALYWAACRQAEAGIAQERARDLLGAAAARAGLGEREIEATVASAFRTLGGRCAQSAQGSYRLGR